MFTHPTTSKVFASSLLALGLLGCAEGLGDAGRAGAPSVPADDEPEADDLDAEVVVPMTTKVVGEAEARAVRSLDPSGSIVVDDDAFWRGIQEGDVLVFGVTEHTPHGWLRAVESITVEDDRLHLKTAQAALPDAIADGEVRVAMPLLGGVDASLVSALPGVAFAGDPDVALRATFDDVVLWDHDGDPQTTDDQVVVDGFVELEMDLDLALHVSWFRLKRFELTASADATGELSLRSSAVPLPPVTFTIAMWKFAPITTFVGPVPVVFVPRIALRAGLDSGGSVSFEGTTGIDAAFSFDSAITWDDGWSSHADVERSLGFQPLELGAPHAVDVRAHVGPELGVLVYDVVGPTLSLRPFLGVKTNLDESRWSLLGGLRIFGSMTVDVLGWWLKPYDVELHAWSTTLAEGTWDAGVPEDACCLAGPEPGCVDAGIEACVCAEDPYCCDTRWDALCAQHVVTLECGTCAETTSCCAGHGAAGCDDGSVEACVCAEDPYCCTTAWDHLCVGQVETLECGTC
jgi:hypothetical protein